MAVVVANASAMTGEEFVIHLRSANIGAVCVVELWPEAKKCKEDRKLYQGIISGVVVMTLTLIMGV